MKMKWGVIGSTGIAQRRTIPEGIVPAKNAELSAVYSPTAERNSAVAAQYGVKACKSERELLESGCDIIYVASPNDQHCRQVIQAAQAGCHVFCEKPLGLSVAEAEEMVAACEANDVQLGVGFMMRFHSYHQEALRIVQSGQLGLPVFGRAQLSCWYPPIPGAWRQDLKRSGGGALPDLATHCIDLLEMLFGRTRRLSCFTGHLVQDYASEDTATVMLEFESGAKGVVDTLFNVPDSSSKNRLEIYGSKGSLRAEGTIGQGDAGEMWFYSESAASSYNTGQARKEDADQRCSPPPVNTYRAEVEAFSQAIIDGNPPPIGAAAALWSQKVIAACFESAETGRAVDFSR
ncbi:MAG: Gfo/Idh/MocA family oxidoreductase [Acidobacteriota bacterium]|nr:MAG: Gfo/Idh/MocA family oxidoreductase [Acidobacteriota bacterium]